MLDEISIQKSKIIKLNMFLSYSIPLKGLFIIESEPFDTKVDLLLGMRFLTETTYTLTDKVLTIKLIGVILQAI